MNPDLKRKIARVLSVWGGDVRIRYENEESAPWQITVSDMSPIAMGRTLEEALEGMSRILDDIESGECLDRWAPPAIDRMPIPGKQTGYLP